MNPSSPPLAAVLLAVALAACGANPEVAGSAGPGGGAGGTGPGGGSGGDVAGGSGGVACEPTALRKLRDEGPPVRLSGFEHGHPARIAGAFPEASPSPAEAARSFLRRVGPGVGLSADGADLAAGPVRRGLAGDYVRFQQLYRGLPVFDHEVVVHVAPTREGSEIRQARLAHAAMRPGLASTPAVPADAAVERALASVKATDASGVVLGFHVGAEGQRLAYRVLAGRARPAGSFAIFVDAADGSIREVRDLLRHADGSGLVFDPNPMASTGLTSLRDGGDVATAVLDAARVRVALPRLDGTGVLRGDWVDARPLNESGRARSPDLVFDYDRSEEGFEQAMAYFHLDRVQARLQELGFTDANARRVVVLVNGSDEENSWYDPRTKEITTGTAGVDDAEDADVLVHEYGHALLDDQVSGFGMGGDAGAIGEGFGDYLAGSIAATLSAQRLDPACLAEWDGVAFVPTDPPCMRRLDGTKHYPEHLEGEVHADGEIWSAALWELRGALGADVVDRLVVESHFTYSRWERYPGAAEALLETDRSLFGGRHLSALIPPLVDRGLLRAPMPPALFPDVLESRAVDVQNPRSAGLAYRNWLDDRREIRVPGAAGLRLHFTKIETERDDSCVGGACDNLYLTDDRGYLFQILNGEKADFTSVVIPGEAVHLRLVTDGASGGYGYRVDRVDVMGYRTCGNGAVDGPEACDGADLGGATCEALGFAGGGLSCGLDCRLDPSACVPPEGCGDGVVGPGEACDGPELQGATCRSLGLGAGRVSCTGACRLDTSGCSTCGNGVREGVEACDGADVGGLTCGSLGLGEGPATCSAACTLDVTACVPQECS